jgi:hypothetical protein
MNRERAGNAAGEKTGRPFGATTCSIGIKFSLHKQEDRQKRRLTYLTGLDDHLLLL